MSSLVPGYMTVSWTVSPPAVGVRATCGVEGRPDGEGRGRKGPHISLTLPCVSGFHVIHTRHTVSPISGVVDTSFVILPS